MSQCWWQQMRGRFPCVTSAHLLFDSYYNVYFSKKHHMILHHWKQAEKYGRCVFTQHEFAHKYAFFLPELFILPSTKWHNWGSDEVDSSLPLVFEKKTSIRWTFFARLSSVPSSIRAGNAAVCPSKSVSSRFPKSQAGCPHGQLLR